jgi:dUTPase
MVIARVEHAQVKSVDALTETARGSGGFGSTGTGHGPLRDSDPR